ncbi:MAG: hypothetical protein JNL67_04110 [Planctomycetaceae bacterium]|nr:hypothetical protein [Planctomycetaceae bacterium]
MLSAALRQEVYAARDAILRALDDEQKGYEWVDELCKQFDFKQQRSPRLDSDPETKQVSDISLLGRTMPRIEGRYRWKPLVEKAARKLLKAGFELASETLIELLAELPKGYIDGNDPKGMTRDIEHVLTTAVQIKQILDECLGVPIKSDQLVVDSLCKFLRLSPFELVQRAAGVGRFDLLPLFKQCHLRGAYLEIRGGMAELVPGPSAIDEVAESLLADRMSAMGAEVARRWLDFSAGIKAWRDEISERKTQWEYDHKSELSQAADLRAVFGDELVEQTERLRMDAGALVRLIERARVTADPKPAIDLRDEAAQSPDDPSGDKVGEERDGLNCDFHSLSELRDFIHKVERERLLPNHIHKLYQTAERLGARFELCDIPDHGTVFVARITEGQESFKIMQTWLSNVANFFYRLEAAIDRAESASDPWVVVAIADCSVHKSTIGHHAKNIGKPYIEKSGERGKCRIKKSRLNDYVKPSKLQKYLGE